MLLRGKNSTFSYRPKSDWAAIYSRAPLHIQKLSLWLKDLYPYSIRLFRSDMSKVKVAFSSSEASKSKFKFLQIGRSAFAAQFIPGPPYTFRRSPFGSKLTIHTLSDGLSLIDLGKTCLFFVGGVKVKTQDFQIRQNLKNLIEPQFISGSPYTFRRSPFGSKLTIYTLS